MVLGMSAAIPLPLPLSEMVLYYEVFKPKVSMNHFLRGVRAADKMYIELTREEQDRKAKAKNNNNSSSPGGNSPSGNTFPAAPSQLPE